MLQCHMKQWRHHWLQQISAKQTTRQLKQRNETIHIIRSNGANAATMFYSLAKEQWLILIVSENENSNYKEEIPVFLKLYRQTAMNRRAAVHMRANLIKYHTQTAERIPTCQSLPQPPRDCFASPSSILPIFPSSLNSHECW
jgi:hypothetical protein